MFQLNDSIVFVYRLNDLVYYMTSSNVVFYLEKIDDNNYKFVVVSGALSDNMIKLYNIEKRIKELEGK